MNRIFLVSLLMIAGAWPALCQRPRIKTEHTRTAEQEILQLEQELVAALQRRDAAFLEQIYADDYIGTNSLGKVVTKVELLRNLKSEDLKKLSITEDDVKVRVYGNTAIVTGRWKMEFEYKGEVLVGDLRFTRVFVKRHQHWQVVAGQRTRIHKP